MGGEVLFNALTTFPRGSCMWTNLSHLIPMKSQRGPALKAIPPSSMHNNVLGSPLWRDIIFCLHCSSKLSLARPTPCQHGWIHCFGVQHSSEVGLQKGQQCNIFIVSIMSGVSVWTVPSLYTVSLCFLHARSSFDHAYMKQHVQSMPVESKQ